MQLAPERPYLPPHLDAEELRVVQLQRLKATLKHVFDTVPHYRRVFKDAGLLPEDVRSVEDISALPFTTKHDLREGYPFGMFTAPREAMARIHVSSGTTGRPTLVGYTAGDLDTWSGLMARCLAAAGGRRGDLVHNAFGYGLFTGGLGWHAGAERLGATVLPVSGGATERQVQLIRELRPSVLMATPSYLLVIADELARQGSSAGEAGLRLAIFGAEPASETLRAEIEASLGAEAFDSYGLSEVMGPGVGQERVGDKGALTIWEDHFLPEIVDPETGVPLAEGEEGELVLTTLTKEGMPVIRYRTRDRTRLLPPADLAMRRIARIAGRTDDMLIVRGVNLFPSQIETLICEDPRLAPHYLIEVSRPNRLDALTVHVEPRPETGPEAGMDAAPWRVAALETERRIKDRLGVTARVVVEPPGTIERSAGKAKRVRDLRPKN